MHLEYSLSAFGEEAQAPSVFNKTWEPGNMATRKTTQGTYLGLLDLQGDHKFDFCGSAPYAVQVSLFMFVRALTSSSFTSPWLGNIENSISISSS